MKQRQNSDWETLLKDHFGLTKLSLKEGIHDVIEWAESWTQDQSVTNTPLHRKKGNDGTDE
ncbi:hypothetical protein [uncultured Faecalicoccus sp.]|uniref:hypothetical protein n=1 Tax=uncultured Faecalicoccus sp. TaxID=1971760 RepID=UPI0025DADE86|nr:hypothetical protein [uncultured Faecalicoccus sp.]